MNTPSPSHTGSRLQGWLLAVALTLLPFAMTACSSSSPVTPTVKGPTTISSETTPTDNSACTLRESEQQLVQFIASEPKQQRSHLTCDPTLVEVARQRAQDMAERDYFAHTTPDGHGPNHLVRQAGYELPPRYSTNLSANNVESIGAGYVTAEGVWKDLLESPSHRMHVLGTLSFYADQVEYGVGYAKGGRYGHYWVVITAEPAPSYAASR